MSSAVQGKVGCTEVCESLGVFEELHEFHYFLLGLVASSHISEGGGHQFLSRETETEMTRDVPIRTLRHFKSSDLGRERRREDSDGSVHVGLPHLVDLLGLALAHLEHVRCTTPASRHASRSKSGRCDGQA